jgi:hypothetical protein
VLDVCKARQPGRGRDPPIAELVSQPCHKPAAYRVIGGDKNVFETLANEPIDTIFAAKNVKIVGTLLEDRTDPGVPQAITCEKADKPVAREFQGAFGV